MHKYKNWYDILYNYTPHLSIILFIFPLPYFPFPLNQFTISLHSTTFRPSIYYFLLISLLPISLPQSIYYSHPLILPTSPFSLSTYYSRLLSQIPRHAYQFQELFPNSRLLSKIPRDTYQIPELFPNSRLVSKISIG